MLGEYLLDSNVLIPLSKRDGILLERVRRVSGVSIPFSALAELHYGARNSTHVRENLDTLRVLAARFTVLFPDMTTVNEYGILRANLKAIGRPIPEPDIWIAALAIQHELVVVSRDEHFKYVPGLHVEVW